jgi:hypothetical protein
MTAGEAEEGAEEREFAEEAHEEVRRSIDVSRMCCISAGGWNIC